MSDDNKPMVAIDTQILIWGVRRDGDKSMIERADWLFESLDDQEAQIVVPSVCVAEYLVKVPEADHGSTLALISDRFHIAPFDPRCCSLAARLWAKAETLRTRGKVDCRVCLRADCLVVAAALTYGADRLCSNDAGCRRLASGTRMEPFDLPTSREFLWGPMMPRPDRLMSEAPSRKRPRNRATKPRA